MKKLLFPLLLAAAMLPAQATDYFLPYTEADGSANVRAAPDTHSKILTMLDYRSAQREILGRQGGNYGKGKQRGFHGQSAIGKHQAGVWRQTAAY